VDGGSAHRKAGVWSCAALVAANMVGTGVFTSLGFQVVSLPSGFVIVMLWGLGGVIALCGALSYAELAAALPRSGGEYHFMSRVYHPALGMAAGSVSVAVGFAAPIALAAMALGGYMEAALPGLPGRWLAVAVVLGLAGIHAVAVGASAKFQVVATILKAGLIGGFLMLGAGALNPSEVSFMPEAGDAGLFLSPAFAVALMYVLYSYSGWNAAAYIIDEVKNPARNLPLALLIATVAVTLAYVGLNALFLAAAPASEYAGRIEVAEIAARALFGEAGGRAMAALIGLGLVASISAMTWAGPRVAQVAGRDYRILRFMAATSASGVPRRALALQTVLALAYLLTGTFEAVLVYSQFALVLCGVLTVFGVVVLRVREPGLARPFRCPLFPLPPLLFAALGVFALIHTAVAKPAEAVAGLGVFVLGIALQRLIAKSAVPPARTG
jgi:basic amino acid/polyamine antiporter, APA family